MSSFFKTSDSPDIAKKSSPTSSKSSWDSYLSEEGNTDPNGVSKKNGYERFDYDPKPGRDDRRKSMAKSNPGKKKRKSIIESIGYASINTLQHSLKHVSFK